MIDEAFELWIEIEPAFPVVLEKDVERLVRKSVGFVDSRKCAEIAMRIGRHLPIKFSDAFDMARRCDTFRKVKDNSMNRSPVKGAEISGVLRTAHKNLGIGIQGKKGEIDVLDLQGHRQERTGMRGMLFHQGY